MVGQYLSNTNESATIPILQKNLEVNVTLVPNFFGKIDIIALLFVFDNYCPIIN